MLARRQTAPIRAVFLVQATARRAEGTSTMTASPAARLAELTSSDVPFALLSRDADTVEILSAAVVFE